MTKPRTKQDKIKAEDSPTAWFCVLENARSRADHEREAEALRQLQRLGVDVRFYEGTATQ